MGRLKDADALIEIAKENAPVFNLGSLITKSWFIAALQSENIAPTVEPKRGKWVEDDHIIVCSECEGVAMQRVYYSLTHSTTDISMVKTPYCPHCGAKMEGETDD